MEKKEVIYNFQQAEPDDFGPSKLEGIVNDKLKELCNQFLNLYVLHPYRPKHMGYIKKCVNQWINEMVWDKWMMGDVDPVELVKTLGSYHVCRVNLTSISKGEKIAVNIYTSPVAGRMICPVNEPGKWDGPYNMKDIARAKCLNMPTVHWSKLDLSAIKSFGMRVVDELHYDAFEEWFTEKKDLIENTLHIILKPGIVPVDAVVSAISVDRHRVQQYGEGKEIVFTKAFGQLICDKAKAPTASPTLARDLILDQVACWYNKHVKDLAHKGSIPSWKQYVI